MTITIQDLFRYLLAIIILVAFSLMIIYFFLGLKNKNYRNAKRFGIIYLSSNLLRLILEHFNLY